VLPTGQVFWLVDRPSVVAFPPRADREGPQEQWQRDDFRPHIQRRDRGGVAPHFPDTGRCDTNLTRWCRAVKGPRSPQRQESVTDRPTAMDCAVASSTCVVRTASATVAGGSKAPAAMAASRARTSPS
jgi:hypothetical protein